MQISSGRQTLQNQKHRSDAQSGATWVCNRNDDEIVRAIGLSPVETRGFALWSRRDKMSDREWVKEKPDENC